jgi:gliding motility-associated-like protein
MNKHIVILLICFATLASRSQSVVAESKGNFCLLNHEKIQTSSSPEVQMYAPVFGDFNLDGLQDVAYVANNLNKLQLHLNAGNSGISVFTNTSVTLHQSLFYNTGNAVSADFNNDGRPDLASINNLGVIYSFRNNGSLSFTKDSVMPAISSAGYYGKLFPIHVDNDNRMDLLCISLTASPTVGFHYSLLKNVSLNNGPLLFNVSTTGYVKTTINFGNLKFDGQAADLNNDGFDEFMFVSDATGDSITMLYSFINPLNLKTTFGFGNAGVSNKRIMLTDVNSDGSRDVAVMGTLSTNLNYVYVYAPVLSNTVITSMSTQTIIPLFYKSKDFTFSDLNNDGLKELVVINGNTNSLQLYAQLSPMNFSSPPVSFSVAGHFPAGMRSVDIDNNNRRDLLTYGDSVSTPLVLLRNFTYRDSLFAVSGNSVICNGASVILKHQLLGYTNSFSSSYTNFQPSLTHTLNVNSAGTYTAASVYSVINSGLTCSVTSNSFTLSSGITPTITLSGPFKICAGDNATITASGAGSYTWTNAQQGSVSVFNPTSSLTYTVIGASTDGCVSSKTGSIDVYPLPIINLNYEKNLLCKNESVTITASGAQTYTWTGGSQASTLSVTQQSIWPQVYIVSGTDENACVSSGTFITIYNDKCSNDIKITNGLTPNNDGDNDFFFIENIDKYPENKVSVFNRWGALIYSVSGYDNRDKIWPKANANVHSGTYYYVVEPGKGEPAIKGWIEIIGN